MKRPKHKVFKRQIDLIRCAVKHAIHRCDILKPEKHAEQSEAHVKKNDWVQWAGQKLKGLR